MVAPCRNCGVPVHEFRLPWSSDDDPYGGGSSWQYRHIDLRLTVFTKRLRTYVRCRKDFEDRVAQPPESDVDDSMDGWDA